MSETPTITITVTLSNGHVRSGTSIDCEGVPSVYLGLMLGRAMQEANKAASDTRDRFQKNYPQEFVALTKGLIKGFDSD